jgi:hypothetical protein
MGESWEPKGPKREKVEAGQRITEGPQASRSGPSSGEATQIHGGRHRESGHLRADEHR